MTRSRWLPPVICLVIAFLFLLYPASLQQKLFAIPYGLDPQRPSHSYFLGGQQLPLEARKTGMFGGFIVVYLFLLATGHQRAASFPPARMMIVLVGFIALMGLDGLNATFFDLGWPHLYEPSLRLRLATGLLTGLSMAALLVPALNGSLWREISDDAPLSTPQRLAPALALMGGFFLLVDARPGILYYPIGLVSVAGLLAEMIVLNMVFVLALTRRAGQAESTRDALPVAVAGLLLSICELALMSVVRYQVLGNLATM